MAENTPPTSIIEGTVKFRDGKKWKSRWCVMRKLSPVADCLHLQLYKDQKDRQKNGQTKCSLSLQQFLGYESGFTLDKQSNTLAILCEDVVPVLAFDTRETLMQWRVKVQHNLGSSREHTALLISAPQGSGVRPGSAKLHYREARLALTTGKPPHVAIIWDVKLLRRYGMVDGKLCVEGGSRSGKGAGLFVMATEKGRELTDIMRSAAFDQATGGGCNMSFSSRCGSVMDKRMSESSSFAGDLCSQSRSVSPTWNMPSSFTHTCLAEVNHTPTRSPHATIKRPTSLARCSSSLNTVPSRLCRSSTMPSTQVGIMSPVWTMEHIHERRSDSDRNSMCSRSSESASDYSNPRSISINEKSMESDCSPVTPMSSCHCWQQPTKCSCKRKLYSGPYENYDVPKMPMPLIQEHPSDTASAQGYYDTPKRLMKCIEEGSTGKLCDCDDSLTSIKISKTETDETNQNVEMTVEDKTPNESHSNYVNISPESFEKEEECTTTLENFESSSQILRSAGFSQEEIEELDESSSIKDEKLDNRTYANPSAECCSDHLNFIHMDGIETSCSSSEKNLSDVISTISQRSEPVQHVSNPESQLLKERSLSSDVCQSNRHTIHGENSISFKTFGKRYSKNFLKSPCILEDDSKDRSIPTSTKSETSFVTRFRDSVKIRRSSSFPSKSEKNRDSSSSNDSGVSTGSLKHHKGDLVEFEVPLPVHIAKKQAKVNKKHRHTMTPNDITTFMQDVPLKNLSFRFEEVATLTNKQDNCEDAETLTRRSKTKDTPTSWSRDSRLTTHSSSSETSDYVESLSISSMSSCDATPTRHAARPRSGKEYQTLDRNLLALAAGSDIQHI